MAQKYKKIDGESSTHTNTYKRYFYDKEEHIEIDLFQREADLTHQRLTCTKNPGHDDFTCVAELDMESFPESLRREEVLEYVRAYSRLVVRVKVSKTSSDRPKDDPFASFAGRPIHRGGTGVYDKPEEGGEVTEMPCSDRGCIQLCEHSTYGFINIRTHRRLVFDDLEASGAEVEFFYDTGNRLQTITAKGYDLQPNPSDDESVVLRCVTHDMNFIGKLQTLALAALQLGEAIPKSVKERSMIDYAIIVSHPHGAPKQVSIGRLLEYRKTPDKGGKVKRFFRSVAGKTRMRVTAYTAATCSGSGGAPVVTGYEGAWGWWALSHHMADLNTRVNMTFTS